MRAICLYFIGVLLLSSCERDTSESSFYYWKTNFHLKPSELKTLEELNTKRLYVKFFDVDLSEPAVFPLPVGVIAHIDSMPRSIEVIPVIFITNKTFLRTCCSDVDSLASRIITKINIIKGVYKELQFDCDWSLDTKGNYFSFLRSVRKLIPKETLLSATIRLHQAKYVGKTGIPPVDKGMLMFYNMGKLSENDGRNSIYNKNEALKYVSSLKSYPLVLDVALPIFRWYVHFSNGEIEGLVTKEQTPDIYNQAHFVEKKKNITFISRTSFFENGIYYEEGDELKLEALTKEELREAASLLQKNLPEAKRRLVFYDLDETNISYYDENTLKKVSAIFN